MAKYVVILVLSMLAIGGCAKKLVAPPQSRFITGQGLFTFCDRGHRIYQAETGHFQVVPSGCPDGTP